MSKMTLGLLSLFSVIAILGTSAISAEATKPNVEFFEESGDLFTGGTCGEPSAHIPFTNYGTITTWESNDMMKLTLKGVNPILDGEGNEIGVQKISFTSTEPPNENGVYKFHFKEMIHCSNGEKSSTNNIITISK